jgi:hypothetical protein
LENVGKFLVQLPNTKYNENLFGGSTVVTCGQTERRRGDASDLFFATFHCERAKADEAKGAIQ